MLSDTFMFGKMGRKKQYVVYIALFVLILLLWLVVPLSVFTKEERRTLHTMPQFKAVEVVGHNFYIRDVAWFACKTKQRCIAGERKGKLFAIIPLDVPVKVAPGGEGKADWADNVVTFPWWSFAVWWVPEYIPNVNKL